MDSSCLGLLPDSELLPDSLKITWFLDLTVHIRVPLIAYQLQKYFLLQSGYF
jgi:hypothetical protein